MRVRMLCGAMLAVASTLHAQSADPGTSRFRFVTAARQLGPVGYRDPIGVMSPDGQWLVHTSSGSLRLMHVAGGPANPLGAQLSRVFAISWLPDSRRVATLGLDENGSAGWWSLDVQGGEGRLLWTGAFPRGAGSDSVPIDPRRFREVAWSRAGARLAGVMQTQTGFILWTGNADGSNGRTQTSNAPISSLAWTPDGKSVACVISSRGSQRVSFPCGTSSAAGDTTPVYGPMAFSADGTKLYFASPNKRGTLDLWVRPIPRGAATRLTSFTRDTYAPSVANDGHVLFGTQDYRTFIAVVPSGGGVIRQVTTFQSETPSWSRDNRSIAFTYGSWRRVVDDLRYPDIAQDLGVVSVPLETPALAPTAVIRASSSEDQGMDWSPNGRWIALHSHADGSDDIWIQPADGSSPARAITSGGFETGWPRWSPNGDWIAYSSEVREGSRLRGALFTVQVDSARGVVTREARRVPLEGVEGDVDAVEWSAASDSLVFLAKEGADRRAIYIVARDGGVARVVHRFNSEQDFSGLGVSPDSRWVAYTAPASDGHFQLFRVNTSGGTATQLTFDPTDKTQPAVSRDGASIAFTVFSYLMQFWIIDP